ncbi:MAG TPA: hypothetical protein VHL98_05050 [Microvirga sp.]|jgi:hypothetical protein|nr:hypothetical protein [Microvirga sp.]
MPTITASQERRALASGLEGPSFCSQGEAGNLLPATLKAGSASCRALRCARPWDHRAAAHHRGARVAFAAEDRPSFAMMAPLDPTLRQRIAVRVLVEASKAELYGACKPGLKLGLRREQIYARIIIPQVFRSVLPPFMGQYITSSRTRRSRRPSDTPISCSSSRAPR